MPTVREPGVRERVHVVGAVLIKHQDSLKAALHMHAFKRNVPVTANAIDDLWSALADRALQNAQS